MLKKYFPVIALVAAALLLWYVKKYQRGNTPIRQTTTEQITIPANNTTTTTDPAGFYRNTTHISYSKHAKCRMDCRHIDESEVKEILETGTINYNKIEESAKGKTYPLEGVTHDKQHVRIVFAPKNDGVVVVTLY